jgi:hypothetical protein
MRWLSLAVIMLAFSCNTVSRKTPDSSAKQQYADGELGCVCVEEGGAWYLYKFYDGGPEQRVTENSFYDVYACATEKVRSGNCFAAF